MCGFISGLYSVSLIHILSVFVPRQCCFHYCGIIVLSDLWKGSVSCLFFLRFALAILGPLWFHKNFRVICSSFLENCHG